MSRDWVKFYKDLYKGLEFESWEFFRDCFNVEVRNLNEKYKNTITKGRIDCDNYKEYYDKIKISWWKSEFKLKDEYFVMYANDIFSEDVLPYDSFYIKYAISKEDVREYYKEVDDLIKDIRCVIGDNKMSDKFIKDLFNIVDINKIKY